MDRPLPTYTPDGLTIDLRTSALIAIKLISGAAINVLPNGQVEVIHCGSSAFYQKHVVKIARDLAERATHEFLEPHGYNPLSLDVEALLRTQDFINSLLYRSINEKRLKVLFYQNGESGCSWWRCCEPARMLNQLYPDQIYAESTVDLDLAACLPFDIIVVQRGLFGEQTSLVSSIIQTLKRSRKKIIYEIDDDLEAIHVANTAKFVYTPDVRRFVSWLKEESDAIFCSTAALAETLNYPNKTVVIPNSIDIARFRPALRESGNPFLFVLWHGGESHDPDIEIVRKPLSDFIRNKTAALEEKIGKTIVYGFLGYMPKFLDEFLAFKSKATLPELYGIADPDLKFLVRAGQLEHEAGKAILINGKPITQFMVKGRENVRYIKGVSVWDFHDYLISLKPDICLCPLNPQLVMNESKSNIKVIESIIAGAASVVSNTGPFKDIPEDVAIKARTPEQFVSGLQELIRNEDKRLGMQDRGLAWVHDNFSLEKNARLWAKALANVAGVQLNHNEIE